MQISHSLSRARAVRERAIHALLFACGILSIFTTLGIVAVLIGETIEFFRVVSLIDFLTDTQWTPLFTNQHFGILPLLTGTLIVASGAMLIALPVGLLSAIFLSEYAPDRVRRILKPMLEILAGIPTVVYGYFALLFITPLLQNIIPETQVFNAASAGIAIGIMIIPLVSSLSEDAMTAVPRSLREAGYAMGATRFEVATQIVAPAALSGILAAFILAISRAIGETMIVAIAAGQQPVLTLNPFQSIETMTAYIVQVSLGDTPQTSFEFKTIFAVGMTLFVMTFALNLVSNWVLRRFREEYQ
ncbi:MAG: phosphate ABC transporter permease subunit PstC [Chloroflexi bacterium]|nr:phosphate ABC transporter permease subunit PstC [Chloroflexota bacterium]